MNNFFNRIALLSACIFFITTVALQAQFAYISPVPGSLYHDPATGIILRNGNTLNRSLLNSKTLFHVTGSISGLHNVMVKLAEADKSILLQPDVPFIEGETVTVQIADGITTSAGATLHGTSFHFEIRQPRSPEVKQLIARQMQEAYAQEFGAINKSNRTASPPGLPDFSILVNTNPASGQIFFHDFQLIDNMSSHICIIKNNGDSVYGKFDTVDFNNFDLNHNGYMTVYNRLDSVFDMLDSNYNKVANYQMKNGYKADVHEFQIFSNGTRYMLAYDPEIVDMTVYDPNYCPNATVVGAIIQELDEKNNVLFQWRSWDHYNITDAQHISLSNCYIDAIHMNSIEVLSDGNLVVSARHLDEISKIDKNTGNFIWRLGGANNQFTIKNDPQGGFSFQHDARIIANGHLTVFDNGNYHVPAQSFAKEYSLDEINKKATLVWNYSRPVSSGFIYASAMGSVQRLSNGNTFICWGLITTPDDPNITEVDAQNKIVWEMELAQTDPIYRSHRFTWDPCARPTASDVKATNITSTTAKISWQPATNALSYDVQYRKTGNQKWKTVSTSNTNIKLTNLASSTKYEYEVKSHCNNGDVSPWTASKKFTTLPAKESLLSQAETTFDLYPNPSNGIVHLTIDAPRSEQVTFTIYDLSGKGVISSSQQLIQGEQQLDLNLTSLPKGIYFAELKSTVTKKIVKMVIE
ncbi:MAG: aryl-sulfate sulfotransferase [Chitinophagales bacterium]|nr:aryl-sulfate sulfotransferase [Chitinophagales bacterium]